MRTSTCDFHLYVRSRINHIVQNDSNRFTDIFFCQAGPCFSTFCVHGHADLLFRTTGLLNEVGVSIRYNVTTQSRRSVAVRHLDCIQVEILFFFIDSLYTPFQRKVTRQDIFYLLHVQVFVDLGNVFLIGNTDNRPGSQLSVILVDLQDSEQRMLLCKFFHALGSLGFRFVFTDLSQQRISIVCCFGSGIVGNHFSCCFGSGRFRTFGSSIVRFQDCSQHIIGCNQLLVDFRQVVCFPKFEVGTTL